VSAGFTPGPWRLKSASTAHRNILDIEGDGRLLAFTAATCDQSEANARLIAEAPELYDEAAFLCERLRGLESELADDATAAEYYGHVVPSIARLESILARARGES
jgi:hypothetical protein